MKDKPKVALIHDYLIQYGGAEKTLEAIMEIYPQAPVYTGIYSPKGMTKLINSKNIYSNENKFMSKFPKYLTFLMPFVFEGFDLSEYDIVISDGSAWAKSVLTKPDQLHISYVHTPPRFLYGYSVESTKRRKWYFKPVVSIIDYLLRIWDYYAAQRPDFLLTNSIETQSRIKKFYNRDAKVIYPPVDINYSEINMDNVTFSNYYLALGRLAAYKNFDFLIKAFNENGKTLVVAGTGPEEMNLKALAKDNIHFTSRVNESMKHALIENCIGVINPVEDEDLGIVPLEAMSHGKPVLAHYSGGHKETIKAGVSGAFFENFDIKTFNTKLEEFEKNIKANNFDPKVIESSVTGFGKDRFQKELQEFVNSKWENFRL